jgi:hypothetical protein
MTAGAVFDCLFPYAGIWEDDDDVDQPTSLPGERRRRREKEKRGREMES